MNKSVDYFSKQQIADAVGLATVTVTSELAKFWLTLNSPNRAISKRAVDEYARRITNGRWLHNGESIKFNKKGDLIDGQHRLYAVIKSGIPIQTDVRFGLNADSKDAIDEGLKRTADGAFKIEGIPHYTNAAAICRGVMSWKLGAKTKPTSLANHEVLEFYYQNPLAERVASLSGAIYLALHRTISRAEIGILMFLFAESTNLPTATEFFDDVSSGHSPKTTVVRLLWERLIADKVSNTKKMPTEVRRALIVKTWNNWIRRSNLKQLKYSIGETFPDIL